MSKRTGIIAALIAALVATVLWIRSGRTTETSETGDIEEIATAVDPDQRAFDPRRGTIDPTAASGRVTKAADGSAIEGAVVVLELPDSKQDPVVLRTDADGAFSAEDLDPGEYSISATAPGFLAAVQSRVELESGETRADIQLQLSEGGSRLRGTVRDITGGLVDEALVKVTPVDGIVAMRAREGFAALTAEDGTYAVQVPDGRHRITVWHPDYASDQRVIEFKAGDREQDFSLTPMAVIEGVVLSDATGQPVPNAKVMWEREQMVSIMPGQRMAMPVDVGAVDADGSGRFRIRGLNPGTIKLRASAEGLASVDAETLDIGIAEQKTGVEITLGAAHSIRGRVVAADDPERGISGANVSAVAAGLMTGSGVQTDAEGYFAVHGVLPGRVRLAVDAKGYVPQMQGPSVEVDGDVDDVIVQLDAGLAITGRVEPAEEAQVKLEIRPEDVETGAGMGMFMLQSASTTSDARDGSFELRPVSPGKVTLVARAADGRMGEVSLEVTEAGARDVIVKLEQRASLSGEVVDTNGEAVTDATVSLKPRRSATTQVIVNGREMGSNVAPTDENGRFTVTGLAAGEYEAQVTDAQGDMLAWGDIPDPKQASKPRPWEIGSTDQTGARLIVESRDGVIEGVVKTAEGEPAPEIWVTASYTPEKAEPEHEEGGEKRTMVMMVVSDDGGGGMSSRSTPPVLTDDEGRFEITGLRDGDYELVADAKGSGARGNLAGVRPGQNVTLILEPMGGIQGKVTSNGSAVRDYVLRIDGLASRTKRVRDGSGKYEVDHLEPGTYSVKVTSDRGSRSETVEVRPGETATLDIGLDEFATVTATVVDKEGNPVVGARVMMASGDGRSVSLELDGSEPDIRTDEEGKLETKCAPGQRVLMIMAPDSPRPIAMKPFVAQGGERHDLGEIKEQDMGGGMMVMGGPEGGDEDVDVDIDKEG